MIFRPGTTGTPGTILILLNIYVPNFKNATGTTGTGTGTRRERRKVFPVVTGTTGTKWEHGLLYISTLFPVFPLFPVKKS